MRRCLRNEHKVTLRPPQSGISMIKTCNNYNQTLKELKSHFLERRTMALVCKLEKYMIQLVQLLSKVTELTDEYKERVNSKQNEDKNHYST